MYNDDFCAKCNSYANIISEYESISFCYFLSLKDRLNKILQILLEHNRLYKWEH